MFRKFTKLQSIFLICAILVSVQSIAADLKVDVWRGQTVLRLSGPIDAGIAKKFQAIAKTIPLSPYKTRYLLLDSPGGLVGEAMLISKIMDRLAFHTVVPNGSECASACASIIFVAGKYRTVEPFGYLGQHSCSVSGQPDQDCNEVISKHGLDHGVSFGSIAAFVTYVPPDDILWFSREDSDGWGLTRYPGESESGFEKSEPRVIEMLTGNSPPAQTSWRLDFREDGYKAFLRPAADNVREMQINLFCVEKLSGRLFLSMEVHGAKEAIANSVLALSIATDHFSWLDEQPIIWQLDEKVGEIITEIPSSHILDFLNKANKLEFRIELEKPFEPMIAKTSLTQSRKVLRFAANHCASGREDGSYASPF